MRRGRGLRMLARMTTLALLRHGRATGQGPDAPLTPEGETQVRRLAAHLAREGWRPAAAFTSPYRRARATAELVLAAVAPGLAPRTLAELTPESEPGDALAALRRAGLPAGAVLVVAHLPLLGRLAQHLAGGDAEFGPGTLAEFELAEAGARLMRRIAAADLTGP
ncbi:MAG TPA: histidine phosphatase family protein [Candidatus Eisenbacteria bacterium]|nr:histidine phosphatase family protein [Candidatus Eisenbacteria bacterium]